MWRKSLLFFFHFFIWTGIHIAAAQPSTAIYASNSTGGGEASGLLTGSYEVKDPTSAGAAGKPNDSFTFLKASSTAGISTAYVHLTFANNVASSTASPTTVYIRVNDSQTTLLGGGIAVAAYDRNMGNVSLVTAGYRTYYLPDGSIYLAITPAAEFRSVRVTVSSPILLGTNSLNVYYAFYAPGASNSSNPYPFNAADCGQPNVSTKGSSGGIALGTFDIQNAGYAIDQSLTTKSSFVSPGVALLGGHIKQTFFFNGVSNTADAVRIVLSQSGSFVAVKLASGVALQAYNGANAVGTVQLMSSLLSTDLLGLLSGNNTPITFHVVPKDNLGNSVIFDRLELDLDIGLLGVALGSNGLNIHDVRRVPDVAVAPDVSACSNIGTALLSALSLQQGLAGVGNILYRWYPDASATTALSSQQSWTATGLTATGQKDYYVEIQKSGSGCLVSPRKKVTVNVTAPPVPPTFGLRP